jgi:hypothetical protein
MTSESLQRVLRAAPFRHVTIVTADGHEIPIAHPERVAHAPGARAAIVMLSEEWVEWIDLRLSPGIVFEPPSRPAAAEEGAG